MDCPCTPNTLNFFCFSHLNFNVHLPYKSEGILTLQVLHNSRVNFQICNFTINFHINPKKNCNEF